MRGIPSPCRGKVRACPGEGRGWGSVPPFALSLSKGPPLHASFRRRQGSRGADARGAHEVGHAWGPGHARNRTSIVVDTAIVEATPPCVPTRYDAVCVIAVYQSR